MYNVDFDTRLKMRLTEKEMSQRELAKKTGLTEAAVSRYVGGGRQPGARILKKLADALECNVSYLIGENVGGKTLTANEYQMLAMRTCNIPYSKRVDMLRHAVFGLNSEAGEVAGILQKQYQQHPFDKEHMMKELGDCAWMLAEACTALGVDLETVLLMNIEKLKARFPEGFSAEKSLHRAEGDI
jgi:transcriptional regulator with XRE-family HTH domain